MAGQDRDRIFSRPQHQDADPVPDAPHATEQEAARYAPTQFAQDLAAALVDPVCRALLLSLVREAVRLENAARAQSVGTPPPVRGSTKTAWVGDALRKQQAGQE